MPSPDFVRFRTGQFLAILGGRCSFLSLSWWLLARTGSKADFTRLALIFSLCGLVSLPILAPLADRWSRKACALAADLWSLAGVIALWAATWDGYYRPLVTELIVGSLALGVSLMTAVSGSIIPSLVPRERLGQAFAAITASQALVFLLAPLLAGFGATWIPLSLALAVNAAMLVVTLLLTASIRAHEASLPGGVRDGWFTSLTAGVRLSIRIPAERDWNVIGAVINGCVIPFVSLTVPVLVLHEQQQPAWYVGAFGAAMAIGLWAGSRLTPRRRDSVSSLPVAAGSVALIGAGISLYAVCASAETLAVGSFACGVGTGLHNARCAAYRSAATPAAFRARLSSWGKWLSQAAVPVGLGGFGWLLQHTSADVAAATAAGIVGCCSMALYFAQGIRELLARPLLDAHDYYLARYPAAFGESDLREQPRAVP
ncbi:MFS transporter [Xanthomonas fragariae]|uniref:MFS transporter n=1 Tax=Xanthomonas fragariae TaxID=48664 RepID=UPI0022AA6660|nr:MFS transporter [Xanthomonas fragariae]WAT14825.1 MFS transporter [Xanthomonas fragariae]